jgi:RHS repeat-associated protein
VTTPVCSGSLSIVNAVTDHRPRHSFPLSVIATLSTSDTRSSWSVFSTSWRWYDPVTGRWLSNDPIGISGGLNQYVFCENDPVNSTDPTGLAKGQNNPPSYLDGVKDPDIAQKLINQNEGHKGSSFVENQMRKWEKATGKRRAEPVRVLRR